MALVISVKDGSDFYVQDVRFSVENIGPFSFSVHLVDGGEYKMIPVDDRKMYEIMPEVRVSCGLGNYIDEGTKKYVAKIVFEAPRRLTILRGDMYRRGKR